MTPQFKLTEGTSAFLKKMREKYGYRQDQVARKMPYNLTGYNMLENGKKFLTLIQVGQLTQLYNMTPAEVINEIFGVDSSVEKAEIEKLRALLDAALEENSALKDKLIAALEGKPTDLVKKGNFIKGNDGSIIWKEDPEGNFHMGIDPYKPEGD